MRVTKKFNNNTTVKYVKLFKKIIGLALAHRWLEKNPFLNYKQKSKEVEREFLLEHELKAIEEKEYKILRLQQVKDVFIFCCYTGLAYVDVAKLSKDNIVLGIDGNKWIKQNRTKTETRSSIPILPAAEAILDKYTNDPYCVAHSKILPMSSNQKMNAYLKEIADLCGITKNCTMHLARHTFATTVTLTNGVSLESVSRMLGHKAGYIQTNHRFQEFARFSETDYLLRNILSELDPQIARRLRFKATTIKGKKVIILLRQLFDEIIPLMPFKTVVKFNNLRVPLAIIRHFGIELKKAAA